MRPHGGELGQLLYFYDVQQQITSWRLDVSVNSSLLNHNSDIIKHNPLNTLERMEIKAIQMLYD